MVRLEDITRGSLVKGIVPNGVVTVIDVKTPAPSVAEVIYKDDSGRLGSELLFRDREPTLEIVQKGTPWNFEADGAMLRLVSEANRIRMAHLFDPHLAVHTSLVDPLPHQITAVYGEMLTRQPLRFLLADDPGAGKTIMAGLLMKELHMRGDLERCLVVCPGSLVDQWQDELYQRFQLPFEILTNDRIESSRTGNALTEMPFVIARLDKLSRDENLWMKLKQTDWDLIVCDEAHKMSASFFSGEVKKTKRFRLGEILSKITRHFLLMSATPHNGKEEDFQLFLSLLDGDRFEGRFRDGVHTVDTSDLMRRLVKEQLVKFDGTPLFPERRAYTVSYELSDEEALLYNEVTNYVREEFNRADALTGDGRKGTVGFALSILQRRLASSPEAIYTSLIRRRERLERRLREEELLKRGRDVNLWYEWYNYVLTEEDLADFDDTPNEEFEQWEEEVVDQATAAQTLEELQIEIAILKKLESLADRVRRSGKDVKWQQLSSLLQNDTMMLDWHGYRRKLVIFTEHRDTLNYLKDRIKILLGRDEAVVSIQGGMGRDERRKVQEAFTQDKQVQVLIATDAAGEGINLQRAHLMVNYDLPWNPNRLEQRFGRIHRIGQTKVCHLWNLLAANTREGDVYLRLLEKLAVEREALGGGVFDVLGKAIDGSELRELLIKAIRYGDRTDVKASLFREVDHMLERERLKELLEERALARNSMDASKIREIKEEMERAEARRLQPHFIASFFLEAFRLLGGSVREREAKRYEITHVPAMIRQRDQQIGKGEVVLNRYERICFDKMMIHVEGKPSAAFICPGHPLLDATIDLILERYRTLLKQGAFLVAENDAGEDERFLFYLEHAIEDGRTDVNGNRRVVSRSMQFIETTKDGKARNAGYAPYLDYRPLTEDEQSILKQWLEQQRPEKEDIESSALAYAIQHLVPKHLREVKKRKEELVQKTRLAVRDRLTKEINYWDLRAQDLRMQEQAGKTNAKLNSAKAQQRADELQARLLKREKELTQEMHLSPLTPVIVGGALVVPSGLLARLKGERSSKPGLFARETKRVEQAAMVAVTATERAMGNHPRDVSADNCGYDIESRTPDGRLRFIEVKGRIEGSDTVTITRNEILTGLNKPKSYILALVQVPRSEKILEGDASLVHDPKESYIAGTGNCTLKYIRQPFGKEPDFKANSVNYDWHKLWKQGEEPHGEAKEETD